MSMHANKIIRPLLIALTILVAGYAVWWWVATGIFRQSIDDWVALQRAEGGTVDYRSLAISGFPFEMEGEVRDFSVRRADGLEWHGERLVARLPPWLVRTIRVEAPGRQRLLVPGGDRPPLELIAQGGTGRLDLDGDGRVLAATMVLHDLTAAVVGEGTAGAPVVTARSFDLAWTRPPVPPVAPTETGLGLEAAIHHIGLPPESSVALGRDIERLALAARVMGAPPVLESRSLAAWSRDGGTIELDNLGVAWGPLSVGTKGTVALDGGLQPVATLTAGITGFQQAVDALVAGGTVRAKDAAMVKVAFAVLTGKSEATGSQPVTADIAVRNGAVFLGPIRLMKLPPVRWP